MNLTFEKIEKSQSELLAEWLSKDSWPYFLGHTPSKEEVLKRIEEGAFFGEGDLNFWILDKEKRKIGLIELYQLDDLAPMFSVRFNSEHRKKGHGKPTLQWLTQYIFVNFPDKRRIEAQTREDNIPMRKLFNKCGYVKEAYYRFASPTEDGGRVASISYGILREDWQTGQMTKVQWSSDSFLENVIIGIDHAQITIPKGTEEAARAFYCIFLGLNEIEKPENRKKNGGFWLQVGDRQLHVGVEDGVDRSKTKSHIAYSVNDLSYWKQKFHTNSIETFDSLPFSNAIAFEFRDPFGNRVELIQNFA